MARRVNRSINRSINRRITRHSTRMLFGQRRPAPPDEFRTVGKAVTAYLKLAERMAKRKQHLFDHACIERLLRQREAAAKDMEAKLARIMNGREFSSKW